jgi:thiamine-phosphate pyrophosphorylase
MAARCRGAGATFIVNDRIDVAALAGAAGVHLGQDDLSPEDAHGILEEGAWIGLSTHNDDQVRAGLETKATYLAAGPAYETGTKEGADPVIGLAGLARAAAAARAAGKPLVAIGGITLDAAPGVIAAGADSIAVIGDLLSTPDWRRRARDWVRALETQ